MDDTFLNFKYLLHPLVITSLGLTFFNDQYLKYQYTGFITGKLSDLCGLFYFPLFLYALISFIQKPLATHKYIQTNKLLYCILITDLVFILFKYTFMREILIENMSHYLFKIQIVPDLTDLFCICSQVLTYKIGQKYVSPNVLS